MVTRYTPRHLLAAIPAARPLPALLKFLPCQFDPEMMSSHLFHVISSLLNCLRLAFQDPIKLFPGAIRSIV
jgi:hypothetical protein